MGAWDLYDEVIEGIPVGIAVKDTCVGAHWSYVQAECGMGISKTVPGGGKPTFRDAYTSVELKTLAALAKSWNFTEASIGVAAINAYYATLANVERMGACVAYETTGVAANPFHAMREQLQGKRVAIVGHFPNVESLAKICDLTVLERSCSSPLDVPDSACEYLLESQDFVFITGTTFTNKTMPRLIELSKNAWLGFVGPSVIPAKPFTQRGIELLAGSVVVDEESAKAAVKGGSKAQWRAGIKKFAVEVAR